MLIFENKDILLELIHFLCLPDIVSLSHVNKKQCAILTSYMRSSNIASQRSIIIPISRKALKYTYSRPCENEIQFDDIEHWKVSIYCTRTNRILFKAKGNLSVYPDLKCNENGIILMRNHVFEECVLLTGDETHRIISSSKELDWAFRVWIVYKGIHCCLMDSPVKSSTVVDTDNGGFLLERIHPQSHLRYRDTITEIWPSIYLDSVAGGLYQFTVWHIELNTTVITSLILPLLEEQATNKQSQV